jgi:glycosyltransferase involved in cell wall biosynthesis
MKWSMSWFLQQLRQPRPRPRAFDAFARRDLGPLLDRHGLKLPEPDLAGAQDASWHMLGVLFTSSQRRRRFDEIKQTSPDFFTDKPRRIYEARLDLREAFPLALTPLQRGLYLDWLLTHARPLYGITVEEILWFAFECQLDPSEGFAATWLLQPRWQKQYQAAFTPAGWQAYLQAVRQEFAPDATWLSRIPLPTNFAAWQSRKRAEGVNVLGHFRYPSGLLEVAEKYHATLEHAGLATTRRDLPINYPVPPDATEYLDPEHYDVSLVVIGACEPLDEQYIKAGLYPRSGVYRIACWAWELEDFPPEPISTATLADEVWTLSEFSAQAVRNAWPGKPVYAMLPAVAEPPKLDWPRAHFGLVEGRFLFVFLFDMGSVMERKNPLGLIRAFRQAFAPNEPVDLVIKVSHAESNPNGRAALLEAAKQAGVTIFEGVMSREESLGLIGCADAYVSLHRAEGLGLTLAEAMLMGKPVIATGYSANLDFMTADTGFLVRHTMVEVGEGHAPYDPHAKWAAPDESHAAELMRLVVNEPKLATEVGKNAKAAAGEIFSLAAAAGRMKLRLDQVRLGRTPSLQ